MSIVAKYRKNISTTGQKAENKKIYKFQTVKYEN